MTTEKPSTRLKWFRELRATLVAAVVIWGTFITTGTFDEVFAQPEVVTAVVEEAADGGLQAVPLPNADLQFEPVVIAPEAVVMECPFEGGCDGVGQAWVDGDGSISAIGVPVSIERGDEQVLQEVVFVDAAGELDMAPEVGAGGGGGFLPEPTPEALTEDAIMSGQEVIIVAPTQDNLPLWAVVGGILIASLGLGRAWNWTRNRASRHT